MAAVLNVSHLALNCPADLHGFAEYQDTTYLEGQYQRN